jgi:hypothetical protein
LDRSSDAEYFFKVPQETTAHTKPQPSKNMKKNIQLLAALALAIGSSVSAKAAVENGNFETGNLDYPWWGAGQAVVVDNDGVFSPSNPSGQNKMLYYGSDNGWAQAGQAVGVLEAGKDYTLTFQLCGAWGQSGSAYAQLAGYDSNSSPTSQIFASNTFNFNSSWSLATLKLSAATISQSYSAWIGKEINLVIGFNNGSVFSIDNVTVTATEPGAIPIVNPSFETGDLSGWLSTGQAAAIDWNGPSPGGSQCAFLSYDPDWGFMWQDVGPLQANKDYTLTFYAAAAFFQESAPLLATLSAWDNSTNSGTTLVSQVYTVTSTGANGLDEGVSDWMQYSLTLPASVVEANFSSWIGKEMSINFGTNNGDPLVVDLVSLVASPSYASWATDNAGSQAANLDWDNDGVSNGVEFFMGSAPGFTANPGLDGSNKVTWINGGNIPRSAYGTKFVVQTSTDLTTWEDVTEQNLVTNDGSLSYILSGSEKQFVRLKVTPN